MLTLPPSFRSLENWTVWPAQMEEIITLQITAVRNAMERLLKNERMSGFWFPGHMDDWSDDSNSKPRSMWVFNGSEPRTLVFFDQTRPRMGHIKTSSKFIPTRIGTSVSTFHPAWFSIMHSAKEWIKGLNLFLLWVQNSLRARTLREVLTNCDGIQPTAEELRGSQAWVEEVPSYIWSPQLEELLRELSSRIKPEEIHRRMFGGRGSTTGFLD